MARVYHSYPPSLWQTPTEPEPPEDGRETASDDESFTEPAIDAQDATNANKLAGLGFVAEPQTPWTMGQGIYVNVVHRFYWDGTAWKEGLVPAMDEFNTPVEPDPENPDPEPVPET